MIRWWTRARYVQYCGERNYREIGIYSSALPPVAHLRLRITWAFCRHSIMPQMTRLRSSYITNSKPKTTIWISDARRRIRKFLIPSWRIRSSLMFVVSKDYSFSHCLTSFRRRAAGPQIPTSNAILSMELKKNACCPKWGVKPHLWKTFSDWRLFELTVC